MGLPYKSLYSYWQHYWTHCIDLLTDNDNVNFKIEGPRMLLKDLVAELEGHGLTNQLNIAYFRMKISELDKSDVAFKKICHPIISCLLQKLQNRSNTNSCVILCEKALNELHVKHYFTLLVDWLAETISTEKNNTFETRKAINFITHLIIAEYVSEGFVLEEIKKYATNIPDVLIAAGGEVVAAPSDYKGMRESDFEKKEDYYKKIHEYIENRNVRECLEVLKEQFYSNPVEAFFLVRLIGLKGLINDYIGDINIYSPKQRQYITSDYQLSDIEKISGDHNVVNAAIPLNYLSLGQAKVYAKAKLEEVIDLLMLTYRTKTPIKIANNVFAVVSNGREISMSVSMRGNDPQMASKNDMMRYLDSLDLTELKDDGFKFITKKHNILVSDQCVLNRRLKNAAHWYSKAVSSEKNEDILLNSWFAVEGLLKIDTHTEIEIMENSKDVTVLNVIQRFTSSIICRNYFHSNLRDIYNRFLFYTNQYRNYYDIPNEIIEKAGLNLNTGDQYRDCDFLNALPDLINSVNDDITRDQLSALHEFYQDKEGIEDKAKQIENDILLIYRLRNMIVHNAALSCVNISFYAREAKYIAQRIIRYVIDKAGQNKTIDEIVLEAIINYQVFLGNFEEEIKKLKTQ